MPSLDPNSWTHHRELGELAAGSAFEGNYGPNSQDPPDVDTPEPRYVYVAAAPEDQGTEYALLALYDAYTGELMSDRPERLLHNLIELATANGWEVVDGPMTRAEDEDDSNDLGDWPDDDPFLH